MNYLYKLNLILLKLETNKWTKDVVDLLRSVILSILSLLEPKGK